MRHTRKHAVPPSPRDLSAYGLLLGPLRKPAVDSHEFTGMAGCLVIIYCHGFVVMLRRHRVVRQSSDGGLSLRRALTYTCGSRPKRTHTAALAVHLTRAGVSTAGRMTTS